MPSELQLTSAHKHVVIKMTEEYNYDVLEIYVFMYDIKSVHTRGFCARIHNITV